MIRFIEKNFNGSRVCSEVIMQSISGMQLIDNSIY